MSSAFRFTVLAVCLFTASAMAQAPRGHYSQGAADYYGAVATGGASGYLGAAPSAWTSTAASDRSLQGLWGARPAAQPSSAAGLTVGPANYAAPSAAQPASTFAGSIGGGVATGVAQAGCATGCGDVVMPIQAAPTYASSPYLAAMSGPCDGPVIPVHPPLALNCPKWFGGVYGLIMDRDGEDGFTLLHSQLEPRLRYFDVSAADMDTAGGVEARIGKTFCNCRWGLELVYWGLYPDDQVADFAVPLPVGDPMFINMDFQDVYVDLVDPMGTPYRDSIHNTLHNSTTHYISAVRLRRSFEYHNVEINLLSGPLVSAGGCAAPSGGCDPCGYGKSGPTGSCGPGGWGNGYYGGDCYGACHQACGPRPKLHVGWLFGVRFFKMDEAVSLMIDAEDGVFGAGDPNCEFAYDIETENNLVGVQLGMNLDYYLTKRLHMEAGSKFGFYGNHINSSQRIANGQGPAYVTSGGVDTDFDFHASEDDIAYLGELRAGLGYKLGCHFRLTGGYRVVAASGVALPLDQIPYGRQFASPTAVNTIRNNGQLVLHGAYAGLEFAW